MTQHDNPYRQKLTEEQRRQLVADVGGGLSVMRASEKYGITPAAAWNLVNKEALRQLLASAGLAGLSTAQYLRGRATQGDAREALTAAEGDDEDRVAAFRGLNGRGDSLSAATVAAAAALERLAHAALAADL